GVRGSAGLLKVEPRLRLVIERHTEGGFSRTFDEGGSMPRRMARDSSQLGAQGEMGTPGSSKVRENPKEDPVRAARGHRSGRLSRCPSKLPRPPRSRSRSSLSVYVHNSRRYAISTRAPARTSESARCRCRRMQSPLQSRSQSGHHSITHGWLDL